MIEEIQADQARFVGETGFIKVSIIENKNGPECWIHELEAQGREAAVLMARARRQAKEWGFEEVWANVSHPRLAMALRDHGWTLEQVILKGRCK